MSVESRLQSQPQVLPLDPSEVSLPAAAEALRAGGLIAFRTDTLYGISAAWEAAEAMARLARLKARPGGASDERPFLSLAQDSRTALEWSEQVPPSARALAERAWPGAVTLILRAGSRVPSSVRAADGSWAVRVPAHDWCRALARETGGAIPSTSANLPGRPPARDASEVLVSLGPELALVVDGGAVPPETRASALIDARGVTPRLLRGEFPG